MIVNEISLVIQNMLHSLCFAFHAYGHQERANEAHGGSFPSAFSSFSSILTP